MIPPDAGLSPGADRQPSAALWDGSRRLWSLWELMRKYDASKMMQIASRLSQIRQMLVLWEERNNTNWVRVLGNDVSWMLDDLAYLQREFSEMELDAAEQSAVRLSGMIRGAKKRWRRYLVSQFGIARVYPVDIGYVHEGARSTKRKIGIFVYL